MRTLELRLPPVALVVLLGAAMAAVSRLTPVLAFSVPGSRLVAAALAVAGLGIALLGVLSFRRAGTTVNPLQPAAASRLVVSGIYRRTRNPMYLGMLLALLGWGLFLASLPAVGLAAAFIPMMNRLQISPEERSLVGTFGPAFTSYQSVAPRWL